MGLLFTGVISGLRRKPRCARRLHQKFATKSWVRCVAFLLSTIATPATGDTAGLHSLFKHGSRSASGRQAGAEVIARGTSRHPVSQLRGRWPWRSSAHGFLRWPECRGQTVAEQVAAAFEPAVQRLLRLAERAPIIVLRESEASSASSPHFHRLSRLAGARELVALLRQVAVPGGALQTGSR